MDRHGRQKSLGAYGNQMNNSTRIRGNRPILTQARRTRMNFRGVDKWHVPGKSANIPGWAGHNLTWGAVNCNDSSGGWTADCDCSSHEGGSSCDCPRCNGNAHLIE